MNDIVRWCAQQFRDDGELIDVVLAREEWLALEHLCKDTTCTPDIDLDVVFLPCEHDFWRSVVSCRDIAGHLGVLNSGEAKIADLQIAVLVDEDIAWLQISVDHTGRVYVFQATLFPVSHNDPANSFVIHERVFGRGNIE